MPYLRRDVPMELELHPELIDGVAEELALARPDGPPEAPSIIEERDRRTGHMSVTVIWDRWLGIDPETRGRIILDAYQRVRGMEEMSKITVALGLTRLEAFRLGFN